MVVGEFRQIVKICRTRSFQAFELARSLEQVLRNSNGCSNNLEKFDKLINSVTDDGTPNAEAVAAFCDEWAHLRNNESIIWIIRSGIALPDLLLAESLLASTINTLASNKVKQHERNEMFENIAKHSKNDTTLAAFVQYSIKNYLNNQKTNPHAKRILNDYLMDLPKVDEKVMRQLDESIAASTRQAETSVILEPQKSEGKAAIQKTTSQNAETIVKSEEPSIEKKDATESVQEIPQVEITPLQPPIVANEKVPETVKTECPQPTETEHKKGRNKQRSKTKKPSNSSDTTKVENQQQSIKQAQPTDIREQSHPDNAMLTTEQPKSLIVQKIVVETAAAPDLDLNVEKLKTRLLAEVNCNVLPPLKEEPEHEVNAPEESVSQKNGIDEQSLTNFVTLSERPSFGNQEQLSAPLDMEMEKAEELPASVTLYFWPSKLFQAPQSGNKRKSSGTMNITKAPPSLDNASCTWLTSEELNKRHKIVLASFQMGFSTYLIVCRDGTVVTCHENDVSDTSSLNKVAKIADSERQLRLLKRPRRRSLFSGCFRNEEYEETPRFYGAAVDRVKLYVNCAYGIFTCPLDAVMYGGSKVVRMEPFLSSSSELNSYVGLCLAPFGYPPQYMVFYCNPFSGTVNCYSATNRKKPVTQLFMNNFWPEACATYCETGVLSTRVIVAVSGFRGKERREVNIYLVDLNEPPGWQQWHNVFTLDLPEDKTGPEKYPRLITFDQWGNLFIAVRRARTKEESLRMFCWKRCPQPKQIRASNPLAASNKCEPGALFNWQLAEEWRVDVNCLMTSLTIAQSGGQVKVIYTGFSKAPAPKEEQTW